MIDEGAQRRVCVITGSSTGIGAATARHFARQGHDVVINYSRRRDAADAVAQQCQAEGAQVLVIRADVADDAQCRALAQEVGDRWGRVDTLVNNAGASAGVIDPKDLDALSADMFQTIHAVNVVGAFQMSRALLPHMRGQGGASIVNVSSMASIMGTGSSIAYAVSKGALNTLTLALARSLAPDIRVNAVLPGLVDSDWLAGSLSPEQLAVRRSRYTSRALLKDVITPDDVAQTVHWLAVEANKVTGQLIPLDAGFKLG
jgi:NAD(P)-dependent dehydrogenase (short-subunit alcohol dehydrogenase family)